LNGFISEAQVIWILPIADKNSHFKLPYFKSLVAEAEVSHFYPNHEAVVAHLLLNFSSYPEQNKVS
jgi:hypothetical protein